MMATTPVAVEGDVLAQPGTTPAPGAASGVWTPGQVNYTSYAFLTVNGVAVIYEASCTFSFSGTSPPPASSAVTDSSDVKLSAGGTVLMASQNNVLLNGDSANDDFGNKLEVVTGNHLKSE